MEGLLKQILGEMKEVNHRLDSLENRFDSLENRHDNIDNRLYNLENHHDNLENRFDSLEKGQEKLQLGQDQLKDNLFNDLGSYFEQIEKHFDTKTDELKDTLEDQQRIIDTLATRSIKHESEIKDFKRILKNQ